MDHNHLCHPWDHKDRMDLQGRKDQEHRMDLLDRKDLKDHNHL